MFTLKLNGTLTSKFAAHVPVIRRWKLVWERREFGTRIDRLDHSFPLFPSWESLPVGGIEIKLVGDWAVRVKRVVGGAENGLFIAVFAVWNGVEVPGTYQALSLPHPEVVGSVRLFDWKTDLWRGVKLDLGAKIVWEP